MASSGAAKMQIRAAVTISETLPCCHQEVVAARRRRAAEGAVAYHAHQELSLRRCRYAGRMRHQRLTSVVVEGFTSIRSAALPLHDLNVLVGANGSGKSNFIWALSVLGRIVDSEMGLLVGL